MRQHIIFGFLVTTVALSSIAADLPAIPQEWGTQTLEKIESNFYLPSRSLYLGEIHDSKRPHPAWTWDASIQLGALCSAARVQPRTYLPKVKLYAIALRSYRTMNHDRPGFDVNPPPKSPDRYYDDNAWLCISLLEAYELTRDVGDLAAATDAYRFMMSGEDTEKGGIYWHEDQTKSKNACSSGPAMLASLRFYHITNDPKYLQAAQRLYEWTCTHLQDVDGLVSDSIQVPGGKVNSSKFTYNSATLLQAGCLLFQFTHENRYLTEAQRVAHAAEKRFVRAEDGIITGSGKLGVKLLEAFLVLHATDHDEHWSQVVARCLLTLHAHCSQDGWYSPEWQNGPPTLKAVRLIDQAAPARAYWLAVEHGVELR